MQFSCGKLLPADGQLVADERRGTCKLFYESSEGSVHFQWQAQAAECAEDDFMIFPGDVDFVSIPNVPSGPCFALKFNHSKVRHFYWLQDDIGSEFGEAFVTRVNDFLNQRNLTNLESVNESFTTGLALAINALQQKRPKRSNVTFFSVLTNPSIAERLRNDQELVTKLCKYLPKGRPQTTAELLATIASPQFRQTVAFLDEIVSDGDLEPLAIELGMDPAHAKRIRSAKDFIDALKQLPKNQ